MRKRVLIVMLMAAFVRLIAAQENAKEAPKQDEPAQAKPLSAYKLQFQLRELQDGKVVNTRDYAVMMQENSRAVDVRIGSRVPVKNDKDFTYLDIGTNLRCWELRAQPPHIGIGCTVEISNFALPDQKLQTGIATAPVLNQIRCDTPAVVEEGKQTVISSIDDPTSTKRYEIAVTATKVK